MLRSCDENKKLTICSKTIDETSTTATLARRIRVANVAGAAYSSIGQSNLSPNASRWRKVRLFASTTMIEAVGDYCISTGEIQYGFHGNQISSRHTKRHIGPALVGLPGPEPGFKSSVYRCLS